MMGSVILKICIIFYYETLLVMQNIYPSVWQIETQHRLDTDITDITSGKKHLTFPSELLQI